MIEVVVSTAMGTLLLVLLATTWITFGRPAVEIEARARIEQEGILAVQSLACDFAGFLADAPGRTGAIADVGENPYQFTGWGLSTPGVLELNFSGADGSGVIAVSYQLEGTQLSRTNHSSGSTVTVAQYVQAFTAVPNPENANQVVIQLTIAFRNFTSTFTMIGVAPP